MRHGLNARTFQDKKTVTIRSHTAQCSGHMSEGKIISLSIVKVMDHGWSALVNLEKESMKHLTLHGISKEEI